MDRRTFLKDAALLVAGLGLSPALKPTFAAALEELAEGRAPVLWLQGQACSGCSVSLLNAENPDAVSVLTRYLSLYFHQTLSAASGQTALEAVDTAVKTGGYVLVCEGAVPLKIREACKIGGEPFVDLFLRAAAGADAVIATGTCAAFGGVPAAPPNITGAVPVAAVLERHGIDKPLINLPGCPAHPGWVVGNLIHLMKIGMPECDESHRPLRNYAEFLHQKCLYFPDYQAKRFARNLGEPGCQFKLGCQGVITKADCSRRLWNGRVNWCIEARGICVGCAHEKFAALPDFPLYRFHERDPDA